jgi:porphobilinogen synthase
VQAEAGVDIVAPSDMMDGRIGAIRTMLEAKGHIHTRIMAYSAKYASAFYGPFRDAVGSAATSARATRRSTRWTRPTATRRCARWPSTSPRAPTWSWSSPGMPYLDIVRRVKDEFRMPTFVYQVSGEYAMLKAAGRQRLAGPRCDDDGIAARVPARRRGRSAQLTLRSRRLA